MIKLHQIKIFDVYLHHQTNRIIHLKLNKMNAIIINNKVTLVDDFSLLKMSIIVPKRNLQRMIELTKCKILSKEPTHVAYNNYAGDLFKVTISVLYKNISQYMNIGDLRKAENAKAYFDLLNFQQFYYNLCSLKSDSVNLYAFGDCSRIPYVDNSTIYYSINRTKHSFINRDLNEFGNKRYINFKGKVYSNRNF